MRKYGCAVIGTLTQRVRFALDYRIVSASGLFDSDWYVKGEPSISREYAIWHYLQHGWREGRSPSAKFDSKWYLGTYEDVAARDIDPLVHFLRHGLREGRQYRAVRQSTVVDSDEYIAICNSSLFDHGWYLAQNPDVEGSDPVEHYLLHGAREGRAASERFDTQWYLARHSDVFISGRNPLVFHERFGAGRETAMTTSLQETLRTNIAEWSDDDGEIRTDSRLQNITKLYKNGSVPSAQVYAHWRRIFSSLENIYQRIVFVPWIRHSEADLATANAVKAAVESHGIESVLLVVTDSVILEGIDWLPGGVAVLVLPKAAPDLLHEDLVRLAEVLVFAMRPEAILNVNSRVCWDLFATKGKALSSFTRLFAMLFRRDYNDNGLPEAYADTHLIRTIDVLQKVYIDNTPFIEELVRAYRLPKSLSEKIAKLSLPLQYCEYRPFRAGKFRMRVLCASELTGQKNILLLQRIIELAPDIDFVIYGTGDQIYENELQFLEERAENVTLRGAFSGVATISLSEFDAFLFTSLCEGTPSTLVDIAGAGLPIVASGVGGVPDLIDHTTGWCVGNLHDEAMYVASLREIWHGTTEALARAQRLRNTVLSTHSWAIFKRGLSGDGSFLGAVQ